MKKEKWEFTKELLNSIPRINIFAVFDWVVWSMICWTIKYCPKKTQEERKDIVRRIFEKTLSKW